MRRSSQIINLVFGAVVLLLVGHPAAAEQDSNRGSAVGLVSLHDGDTVWVTTDDGLERQAKFRKLLRIRQDPTSSPSPTDTAVLVIALPSGVEELPLARVRRVVTRDPVGNGALVGLFLGGTLGFLMAGPGCADDDECAFAGPTLIFAGIGAAIGLGIDASREGRTTIYLAPDSASRIRITPFAARRGGGLRVSIGF